MDDNYWILAIVTFLFILSRIKYTDIEKLRDSIMEYLSDLSQKEVIEDPDDILELEEIPDSLLGFIVENKELFSKIQ